MKIRLGLLVSLLLLAANSAQAAKIRITLETPGGIDQYVYLSRPVGLAADRPVVFVMHGMQRNAEAFRDQWHDLSAEHDFLLVVPEFSERDFPGPEAYNLGNVFDGEGHLRSRSDWSFSAIETIFDEVRKRYGMQASGYALYGHSAGAEFVHRYLFFVPQARVTSVVAANADWYTMPVPDTEFPYGLGDSTVPREALAKALQERLTVLLGDADNEAGRESLRSTPEALAQGAHRLERGRAFYAAGLAAARRLSVPFAWRLETVPGVGHDNVLMAPAAIPYLLPSGQDQEAESDRAAAGKLQSRPRQGWSR